jgi:uncharacterized membrane protein
MPEACPRGGIGRAPFHLGKLITDFKHDRNRRNHVFYRWLNEINLPALIGITSSF